jgi:hypothetical protein
VAGLNNNLKAQTKGELSQSLEMLLQESLPGSKVSYYESTLIVKLPLTALARTTSLSNERYRTQAKTNGMMTKFAKIFINQFASEKQYYNEIGFYYVIVIIVDDASNYEQYKSPSLRIKYY